MSTPTQIPSDAARYQALLSRLRGMFGDDLFNGLFDGGSFIHDSYVTWQSKDGICVGLREFYVQRDCADRLLVNSRKEIDKTIGTVKKSNSQIFAHWQTVRTNIQEQIDNLEAMGSANRTAAVGQLGGGASVPEFPTARLGNPFDPALRIF